MSIPVNLLQIAARRNYPRKQTPLLCAGTDFRELLHIHTHKHTYIHSHMQATSSVIFSSTYFSKSLRTWKLSSRSRNRFFPSSSWRWFLLWCPSTMTRKGCKNRYLHTWIYALNRYLHTYTRTGTYIHEYTHWGWGACLAHAHIAYMHAYIHTYTHAVRMARSPARALWRAAAAHHGARAGSHQHTREGRRRRMDGRDGQGMDGLVAVILQADAWGIHVWRCMCVCVYAFMYVCMYTCNTSVCRQYRRWACTSRCVFVYMYIYVYVYIYIHIYIEWYVYVCMYIYIYIYIYIYMSRGLQNLLSIEQ
jgi:hypothetical protein